MNPETLAALEALATKLGTTSEYLWGVLIRQASVYAVTTLVEYAIVGALVYVYVRWGLPAICEDWREPDNAVIGVGGLVVGILLSILVLTALFSVGGVVTALIHPEYWALKQVLGAL